MQVETYRVSSTLSDDRHRTGSCPLRDDYLPRQAGGLWFHPPMTHNFTAVMALQLACTGML